MIVSCGVVWTKVLLVSPKFFQGYGHCHCHTPKLRDSPSLYCMQLKGRRHGGSLFHFGQKTIATTFFPRNELSIIANPTSLSPCLVLLIKSRTCPALRSEHCAAEGPLAVAVAIVLSRPKSSVSAWRCYISIYRFRKHSGFLCIPFKPNTLFLSKS